MNGAEKTFETVLAEAARELVQEDITTAQSIDTSNTEVSARAKRRVRRLIKNYEEKSEPAKRTFVLRRVVAAVIIACTVSFSLCMSVKAVRERILDTIVSWCDKFASVFYVAEDAAPEVIEEYREPTVEIPGVEKVVVFENEKMYRVQYNKNSEIAVLYQQMTITERYSTMDNKKCDTEIVDINGYEGQLFSYDYGGFTITWHDDEYKYILVTYSSEISKEMLIGIASSVK